MQLKLEATIKIPEHLIVIEKIEYEKLKNEQLEGRYWTLKDLEERTGRKRLWLQNNVLYVPRFKKELEKFVHYPKGGGDNWLFQATKMSKFLEDNFNSIFKGR